MKLHFRFFLAAIIVLTTTGCASLQKSRDEAMISFTCAKIKNLKSASEMYYLDTAKYPASLQDLIRNPGIEGWGGPYVSGEDITKDAWRTALKYELVEGVPEISSAGPDKQFGTADDIRC